MINNANIKDPLTEIKWICYDIYITVDKRVINQDFNVLKEKLNNSSYGYKVNGKFRSKSWINRNCVEVLGHVEL